MDPNEEQPPPEPTLPSQEQMRARRLAKLGAATSSSSKPKDTGKADDGTAASKDSTAATATATASTSLSTSARKSAASPAGGAAAGSSGAGLSATASASFSPVIRTGNKDRVSSAGATALQGDHIHHYHHPTTKRPLADVDPAAASPSGAPTDPPARRPGGGTSLSASPQPSSAITPSSEPSSASTPAVAPPTSAPVSPADVLAEWTDHVISTVVRITVDPNQTRDRSGHHHLFLPGLRGDMLERAGEDKNTKDETDAVKKALRLTIDDIDPAIVEVATLFNHKRPLLEYLLPCYKAATRLLKTRITSAERLAVLHELKRLFMSNIVFALTMPEYFGREPNREHDTIVPYLLRGVRPDDTLSLDMDFITDAVARFDDDEDGQVQELFTRAMVEISSKLATMTMNDEYLPYMEALLTYSRFKPLLVALARHPSFQMAQSAPNIERFTLLGPFFRISPLQHEVATMYFGGHHKVEMQRKETVYSALQMTVNTHQSNLHTIAMAFARAGDGPRNRLLDWFAYAMNMNHKRRAMQVSNKEVASDGFMMNVAAVLDRMCEPFMEANFSRMERIDIDYLRRKPRISIADETKLNADQAQSDAFYGQPAAGESKFVSELFFLNMASHHYGSGATGQRYKDIDREIKHMEGQLAMLEEERKKLLGGAGGSGGPGGAAAAAAAAAANPRAMALVEQHLKTFTAAIDRHVSYKYALEAVLSDEKMQQRSLMFMRYVSVWLLRVASRSDYTPDKELKLPLPADDEPEAFSCLPEYALQNVVDHFKFLFRRVPRILPSAVGDEMVALCITFLESSEYIRNPYLKSSLVSLLYSGTWRMYHLANGVLGDALANSKFANRYLLHALMKFYIECESTGAHTQFYDKFNIRYEIFQVIKSVWPNDLYKQQLTQQSRSFFVRFVNMLLNDATYVLDEALSKFPKIHDLQRELQESGSRLTPEVRQQKEAELQQAEGQAQSYMQLANETVAMMKLFTGALSDAFTMPEIVSRLAGMLDYNLVTLAGPASRNLKVDNAEKYFFNPKVLLPQLVELYLNLGDKQSFVDAVAADGRSYKPDIFANATRILATKGLMDPAKLQDWEALMARFAATKKIADQAETDLGEIPSEFEDPIMGDLMRDPVILPSRHTVDRSTITQHLLSDPKDPFTRQPMTMDDVVPDDALRAQIDDWKAGRIAAARAKHASEAKESAGQGAGPGGDVMDTREE